VVARLSSHPYDIVGATLVVARLSSHPYDIVGATLVVARLSSPRLPRLLNHPIFEGFVIALPQQIRYNSLRPSHIMYYEDM